MNLEGSLDAFGLADVFVLLASTGKSGRLLVRRRAEQRSVEGEVWFRDGRVSGASSDVTRAALLRRIVGSGTVEDTALRQAVARAAAGGRGAARALLDASAVDPGALRTVATEQTVDAVVDLLGWTEGEFSFELGVPDPDDIGVGLDPHDVVTEATARAAAFAALSAVVPGPDSVLVLAIAPEAEPVLSREEWALLALVDGRREVRDLEELTGAGHFAVLSMLAELVQRGLLALREECDHVAEVERRLALLAALEDPAVTEPTSPLTAPPRSPTLHEPTATIRHGIPEPPGAHGLTAAAALAAVRAAQARPAVEHEVVPQRPEPFLPGRRPEHPEPLAVPSAAAPMSPSTVASSASTARGGGAGGAVVGATARNLSEPAVAGDTAPDGVIERDPSVNRSLLLRLIAGVRGL